MYQLSVPMKVIISSGSFLTLLALGGLVCMSNTVLTSDIGNHGQAQPLTATIKTDQASDELVRSSDLQSIEQSTQSTPLPLDNNKPNLADIARPRSGRLYQQASQPIESYAAAYAATNSADQAAGAGHQSAGGHQEGPNQADAGAYASFGETLPQSMSHSIGQSSSASSLVPGGSMARQLSNQNDYSSNPAYYANHHMAPSSNEVSYSGQPSSLAGYYPASSNGAHHHQQQHHHHYKSGGQASVPSLPYGYPTNVYERSPMSMSYYDRGAYQAAASSPFWSASSFNAGSGGLMSSASHALSHWTNGFSIGEIICGLVALTIGAVILGAPFFLIYLALMGNFSGSGTLSLTNPTSASGATGGATQANGRRKRLAVFETMNMDEQASMHPDLAAVGDALVKQLSPLVDLGQVSKTFKHLIRSIEKYSPNRAEQTKRANKQKSSR